MLDLPSGERLKYIQLRSIHTNEVFEKTSMEKSDHQLFVIASNRGYTYSIFDNEGYGEILTDFGLTRQNIFPCLFNYLFEIRQGVCSPQPVSALQLYYNRIVDRISLSFE